MIVVDTSVWIDHLRRGVSALAEMLERGDVATHPFVIGELACGSLSNRTEILSLLSTLPEVPVATQEEVVVFIERRKFMGRGLGLIDVHLLAAVTMDKNLQLWTRDKRLLAAAVNLEIEFAETK